MTSSIQDNPVEYVETGCYGPELVWTPEQAAAYRALAARATGRDCLHGPDEPCFLIEGALR